MNVSGAPVRQLPWTIGGYAANKVLGFASTALLARLLVPEDFGRLAIASVVFAVLSVVRDLGVGALIVLQREDSRRLQGNLLSLMTLGGVVSGLLGALIGALFLLEDRLTGQVVVAFSACLALAGPAAFLENLLRRDLLFRSRFISMLAQAVGYAVVAVTAALAGAGVWSFVYAQAAVLVAGTTVNFGLVGRRRVGFRFDWHVQREALRRGRPFLAQNLLNVLQQNTDYATLARTVSAGQLGLYYVAFRVAEIPYAALGEPVGSIAFPYLARARPEAGELRSRVNNYLALSGAVAVLLTAYLSVYADVLVRVVYGDRFLAAVPILQLLSAFTAGRFLLGACTQCLNALQEAGPLARLSVAAYAALLFCAVPAAIMGGIKAVAVVMAVHSILYGCAGALLLAKVVSVNAQALIRTYFTTLPIVLATLVPQVLVLHERSDLPIAALCLGLGLPATTAALAVRKPALRALVLQQARSLLGSARS